MVAVINIGAPSRAVYGWPQGVLRRADVLALVRTLDSSPSLGTRVHGTAVRKRPCQCRCAFALGIKRRSTPFYSRLFKLAVRDTSRTEMGTWDYFGR
jgi:hypothetical protein